MVRVEETKAMENSKENNDLLMEVKQLEPSLVAPAMDTPKGIYYLSNLDQTLVVFVQTIYFFKSDEKANESSTEVIKEALGKVLVHYYPLAGGLMLTTDGRYAVDCTGEGVLLVEAEAQCELEEIENHGKMDVGSLGKLVYSHPEAKSGVEVVPLLMAQVTKFKCGGFALGLSLNHCMADGIAAMEFVNSWGETARNLPLSTPPFLDRTLLKPRTPSQISFPHHKFTDIQEISNLNSQPPPPLVYASFIFDDQKLSHLRQKAMDETTNNFTTFESLAGFIWKSRTQAQNFHPRQPVKLLTAVNGRNRFQPPLPNAYFGNAIMLTCATTTAGELTARPVSFAARLVHEAVGWVTDEYMRSAIDHFEEKKLKPTLTATVLITTWTRLDFHKVNFGWGPPVRTGPVGPPGKEVCLFLSSGKERKSIDVLLGLQGDAMHVFEDLMEQV